MAKISARGREEIFRVKRTHPGSSDGVTSVDDYRALTSDGSILERMVIHYTPEEKAKNYGKGSHDYGWKIRSRARSGKTLEELLHVYLDKGWQLVEANRSYFDLRGGAFVGISQKPFITEEAAATRSKKLKRSRAKASELRAEHSHTHDGPGFYVTNNYTGAGSIFRNRIADHERPFESLHEAEKFALQRVRRFTVEFSFQYLLPVLIIQSTSRQEAEAGQGRVWWTSDDLKASALQSPGFFITTGGEQVDDGQPYDTLEAAIDDAAHVAQLASTNKISIKLPLRVVQASSLAAALSGRGHVWWENGVDRGPPVHPKQTGFQF
jgi:hypothetical protein